MMNYPGQVALVTIQEVKQIQFSITNTEPASGAWIMRPWVGLHDGKFPTFTVGQAAASGVQHIAEDGITGDPANLLAPLSTSRSSSRWNAMEIFSAARA